jgi:uncharacterized membrane protein
MNLPIPLHPVIVHTPIALILFSLLFELVGRFTDIDWWRKAAFAMLVIGVLGAGAAVLSGNAAEETAEDQGVPDDAIEAHEEAGTLTLWLGVAAVLARALASRPGPARGAVSLLALVAHLLTAGAVGMAGFRGGILVYDHGAGIKASAPAVPGDRSGRDGGEHDNDD